MPINTNFVGLCPITLTGHLYPMTHSSISLKNLDIVKYKLFFFSRPMKSVGVISVMIK